MAKWESLGYGVRVTVSTKHYPLQDLQQRAVISALTELGKYGHIEPLSLQVQLGNPYVLINPQAREVLASALKSEGFKGGKGRRATLEGEKRKRLIGEAIEYLSRYWNMAIFDRVNPEATACGLVAEHAHKTAGQVYKVWQAWNREQEAIRLSMPNGLNPPNHSLNGFFCNVFEQSPETWQPAAAVRFFLFGEVPGYHETIADRVMSSLKRSYSGRFGQLPI